MKKYIFNLLLLFCCTCSVYAQNSSVEVQTNRIEVEGLVTDESKEPLIGVNVIIKDRKSTRLNSSHNRESRMPSSA